jgi:hypothetical protein
MSRTDELREGGTPQIGGGGGGAPFVKWPEKGASEYAFIEGEVFAKWTGKYGTTVTMRADHGQFIRAVSGSEDDQVEHKIEPGMDLNVSFGYSTLKEAAELIEVGHSYHIAFSGWRKSESGGNTYRMFEVFDLGGTVEENIDGDHLSDPDDLPF